MNRYWLPAALLLPVVGALMAFCLPWLTSSTGAALTFNAFDLAEWGSLHPGAYSSEIILVPSGLIRLSLVLMAAYVGLSGSTRGQKRISACIIVVLAAIAAPPAEFLRFTENANYRQMALMSFLSLGLGGGGLLLFEGRLKRLLTLAALLAAIVTSITGYITVSQLLGSLDLTFSSALGVWMFVLFAGLGILFQLRRLQNQKRSGTFATPY